MYAIQINKHIVCSSSDFPYLEDTPAGVPSDQIDNSDVYSSLKHPIKLSPIEEPVTPSLQRRAMLGKSVSLKLDDHEFEGKCLHHK